MLFRSVFINQRGDLVPNDDYLFANDAPVIGALFESSEDISFLSIPEAEIPRLGRLLDSTKVQRLSDCITIKVLNADSGHVDEHLTSRVQRSVNFFARVLYLKRPEVFERMLGEGAFSKLRELKVAKVQQLNMLVSLGDYSRETTADIAMDDGCILYRAGARSVKDLLAAELSRFLGASSDLSDTFARIVMESKPEDVEDFLKVRGIGPLPSDLLKALDQSVPTTTEEDGLDGAHDSIDDQSPDADDSAGVPDGTSEEVTRVEPFEGEDPTPKPAPSSGVDLTRGRPTQVEVAQGHTSPTKGGGQPETGETRISDTSLGGNIETMAGGERRTGATPPNDSPIGKSRLGQGQPPRTKGGRLLSYAADPGNADKPSPDDDPARVAAREATGQAAVDHFMATQSGRWKSLTEMHHNNPGYDILAIAEDGEEEFIEVKGQSAAWTQEGVALTPTELMTAQRKGDRYWLCVVEYAQTESRRQLHLVRNPYGLVQQFRFDVGWKSVAESMGTAPMTPEKNMYIDMQGVGRGRIVSVRGKGRFYKLHVILENGTQINKPFNPARMTLSKDPTWQG